MTMGSVITNDAKCELFEVVGSALIEANTRISAVHAERASGISAKHPSKIYPITHEEAAWTIDVMS